MKALVRFFVLGFVLAALSGISAARAQLCEKEYVSRKSPRKRYFCKFACLSRSNTWVGKEWESKGQSLSMNYLDMRGCPPRFLFSFYGWDPLKPYCTDASISLDQNHYWSYNRSNTKPGSVHKFVEQGIRFECRPQAEPAALVWTIDEPPASESKSAAPDSTRTSKRSAQPVR